MSENETELSPVNFTYEYAGAGWAKAWISCDEEHAYFMDPSYVTGDPIFTLLDALVEVMTYGGEARCLWLYEPAEDRWILRRKEGEDVLHITILGILDGWSHPSWPDFRGEVMFSASCDLWKFAHKVRLAASRVASTPTLPSDHNNSEYILEMRQYKALCAFLDARKPQSKHKQRKAT